MIHIRDIDHIVLRVDDLSAALRFYQTVLGCRLERERPDIGLYQLRAGRSMIDLVLVDSELGRGGGPAPGKDAHNMDHLCLRVEPFDAEAIAAHLRAHGIDPGKVAMRYGAEGEGPSMYINDSQGNTIELKGPPVH